ncbi:MAG: trigger factor [Thiotrichales bacterium 32-46-8]|nr:trigger factor [Gammaproteobacteria bacterium]OYX07779.1 MAG: trigger factor [Thiotrichales bacterium 32-46-8]OYY25209.1 MAG: trigger factor [Thiotrichales bacterium 35-46-9]OYZ09217.1 MAG: trigger factor [Thiotrichales bacterium 16-46-22]OZA20503.1 MAG: trigger factor [Thiotrichales bacterium 17-46-47]OZA98267.1 MAG: trigger factor [Thiotrichales bacterium 34-46-19]HQT02287.1 trigger factor [Thiotrichales bacterium]
MQVSIQRPTEGLEHVITVSVGSEGMTSAVEQRLKEIQKTVRMDGFRPGKVPMNMVRARHLQQVRAEALENLLYDSFFKAADQEQVRVAGILGFEEVSANEGEDIRFVTRFETYPSIAMPDFTAVSVEKVTADIKDSDVDDMIQRLREMRKTYVVVDKAAANGDMVNLDFSGSIDGVKFDGGSAENVPLVLGSGRMIPGFEDGILGMKAGEQKVIDVTFPEGYQAAHLAGKTAQFDIKVNSVQETQLPEVDEEFIKTFGVDAGTVEAFREDVKKNLSRQVNLSLIKQNKDNVMHALLAAVNFDTPKTLVERELRAMMDAMTKRMREQNMPASDLNPDNYREEATKRVSLGLLLGEVVRANELKADEATVREILAIEADSYDNPEQFIEWYLADQNRRSEVEAIAIENAVVDLVMSKAKVTEVSKPLAELAG